MKTANVLEIEKVFLSNEEAQAYLGVGPEFFKAMRGNGKLPYYKVGRTVFYKKSVIDKLIKNGKVY